MPKSTTVLIIRHCEKPPTGTGLTVAGEERSRAYPIYFQKNLTNGEPIKLDFLFAAADTPESHRSRLTLEPLAHELMLKIDNEHRDHREIVEDILDNSKILRVLDHRKRLCVRRQNSDSILVHRDSTKIGLHHFTRANHISPKSGLPLAREMVTDLTSPLVGSIS